MCFASTGGCSPRPNCLILIFEIRDHHSLGANVRLQEIGHHLAGCDEAASLSSFQTHLMLEGLEGWSFRKQPGESILTPQSDSPRYLPGTLRLLVASSDLFDPLSRERAHRAAGKPGWDREPELRKQTGKSHHSLLWPRNQSRSFLPLTAGSTSLIEKQFQQYYYEIQYVPRLLLQIHKLN